MGDVYVCDAVRTPMALGRLIGQGAAPTIWRQCRSRPDARHPSSTGRTSMKSIRLRQPAGEDNRNVARMHCCWRAAGVGSRPDAQPPLRSV